MSPNGARYSIKIKLKTNLYNILDAEMSLTLDLFSKRHDECEDYVDLSINLLSLRGSWAIHRKRFHKFYGTDLLQN